MEQQEQQEQEEEEVVVPDAIIKKANAIYQELRIYKGVSGMNDL